MIRDSVVFEPDFQKRVLFIRFKSPVSFAAKVDYLHLRSAWMEALKSWHSPYTAVIDWQNIDVTDAGLFKDQFALMLKFFQGLFLKKTFVHSCAQPELLTGHELELVNDEEQIRERLGLERKPRVFSGNFRDAIQFQNDFKQHVIEMSLTEPVVLSTDEQLASLKTKLSNNLMQWHSKWSLLVNCENLQIDAAMFDEWNKLMRYFRGFFMKNCLGYNPASTEPYPFTCYRSRHKAVGQLESEGAFMGNEANCNSKK
jgi:hypothetical protein